MNELIINTPSNKIEEQFKKYFQSKIDNNLINLLALLDIQNELKELINTWGGESTFLFKDMF